MTLLSTLGSDLRGPTAFGGQLFRPFSLCIFQNLSCLYDGGQLFRPFLLLFYYYPGRNPLLSF